MAEGVDGIYNFIWHSDASSLGDLIRRHRGGKGWTLRHLAQESGLDPGYLSRVEQGSAPSDAAIDALVRSLGLPSVVADQMRLLKALDGLSPHDAEVLALVRDRLRSPRDRRSP